MDLDDHIDPDDLLEVLASILAEPLEHSTIDTEDLDVIEADLVREGEQWLVVMVEFEYDGETYWARVALDAEDPTDADLAEVRNLSDEPIDPDGEEEDDDLEEYRGTIRAALNDLLPVHYDEDQVPYDITERKIVKRRPGVITVEIQADLHVQGGLSPTITLDLGPGDEARIVSIVE